MVTADNISIPTQVGAGRILHGRRFNNANGNQITNFSRYLVGVEGAISQGGSFDKAIGGYLTGDSASTRPA